MASRKTCTARGFTLFEVVVVLAVVAVLSSASLLVGIDSYRAYAYRSDRDLLVTALQHARASAMGNVCRASAESTCTDGRSYGVRVDSDAITIFQSGSGASDYAHRDASVDARFEISPNTTITPSTVEVVFTQLSGDVASPATITLSEPSGRTAAVTVGSEGQIGWTH